MEKLPIGDNSSPVVKSGQKRARNDGNSEQGNKSKRFKETDCPYMNTIKRYLLDFDFK